MSRPARPCPVKCEQCHDTSSAKTVKIGPPLYGVIGRARSTNPGFSYSSAMMSDHTPWTFALLFKYLKSHASMVPGTKMSFAGLLSAQDRINLIAFLRTNSDSPVEIPAPAPPKSPRRLPRVHPPPAPRTPAVRAGKTPAAAPHRLMPPRHLPRRAPAATAKPATGQCPPGKRRPASHAGS